MFGALGMVCPRKIFEAYGTFCTELLEAVDLADLQQAAELFFFFFSQWCLGYEFSVVFLDGWGCFVCVCLSFASCFICVFAGFWWFLFESIFVKQTFGGSAHFRMVLLVIDGILKMWFLRSAEASFTPAAKQKVFQKAKAVFSRKRALEEQSWSSCLQR